MSERASTKGRERPILFSAPMVRALLAGTKTQTRRVIPAGRIYDDISSEAAEDFELRGWDIRTHGDLMLAVNLPIDTGDRLWVRESGQLLREAYDHDPRCGEDVWRDAGFYHSADGEIIEARRYDPPLREWIDDCSRINRPSIHMPRWASRLTLTVTDVRVQRLQEISEEDARAECAPDFAAAFGADEIYPATGETNRGISDRLTWCKRWYSHLWNEINGAGSWDANPWVAAYTFTVEHRNIDANPTPDRGVTAPVSLSTDGGAGR